ncbi:MAG: hypothetical protein ACI4TK_01715 [Agathobacter sp.]
MKEKRKRRGWYGILLAAMLMMSSITVFANGNPETYADPQTGERQIDVTVKFILDGVEAEEAGFAVRVPAGYELSDTDIEDLLEAAAEELGDDFEVVGVCWDEAGTIAIQTGDRIEGEATLYIFARTVENTPDPVPTPSDPTPTDPTPTDPTPTDPSPTDPSTSDSAPTDPVQEPVKAAPKTGDKTTAGGYVILLAAVTAAVGVIRKRKAVL